MIRDERLAKIGDYIEKSRYVNIHELVAEFSVSKATIRRDLEILAASGEIQLTHGGAKYVREAESERPYDEKRKANNDEKSRIGKAACDLIRDGHTIILDTGTTTREMVRYLLNLQNIHVITNDVMIAAELAANTAIDITLTGGSIRKGYYTLRGYYAEDFIKQLHADILFLSLDSIDSTFGGAILNIDEVATKQRMINAADLVVTLCDHTKYESKALMKVCELSEIDLFITGRELREETQRNFEEKGYHLQVV
ncbi:MAG TPA: DeoR/GlpR family DNA-binding transcription regulator [Anaerovoracaceae bacterium]|nr:DeoR/GlpR family DNA-binding transcription regulator [Anaerovoracaceae bacterium]